SDLIGGPHLAAVLALAQRGLEEINSARNAQRLLAEGGHEEGATYYPVVAATPLAWIASLAFLISPQAPIILPLIAYYLGLQVVRYWVIASLGRFWTHRIVTIPGAPGPLQQCQSPQLCRDSDRDFRSTACLRCARACRHHDGAVVGC